MKLYDVVAEVERIKSIANDDEAAHVAEDNLYVAVLAYYANGGIGSEMASAALKTKEIRFARWCA